MFEEWSRVGKIFFFLGLALLFGMTMLPEGMPATMELVLKAVEFAAAETPHV